MKTFFIVIGIAFIIGVFSIVGFVCNNASRFVDNGVETAHKELRLLVGFQRNLSSDLPVSRYYYPHF